MPKSGLLIGAAIIALGTLEAFTVATEYGATETPELWWGGQALVIGLALHAYATRARHLAEHERLERDRKREAAEAVEVAVREGARIAREPRDVVAHDFRPTRPCRSRRRYRPVSRSHEPVDGRNHERGAEPPGKKEKK